MALEGKQILITSGGTVERWDQVRGHTNLAKGTIGCYLAEQALARGADVTYLHGYFARVPERHHRLRVQPFEGVADLREKIRRLLETEPVRAVIMAAAVSDWVVEKIVDQEGRIVPTLSPDRATCGHIPINARLPKGCSRCWSGCCDAARERMRCDEIAGWEPVALETRAWLMARGRFELERECFMLPVTASF